MAKAKVKRGKQRQALLASHLQSVLSLILLSIAGIAVYKQSGKAAVEQSTAARELEDAAQLAHSLNTVQKRLKQENSGLKEQNADLLAKLHALHKFVRVMQLDLGDARETNARGRQLEPEVPVRRLLPTPTKPPPPMNLPAHSQHSKQRRQCLVWMEQYNVLVNQDWGSMPPDMQDQWTRKDCNSHVQPPKSKELVEYYQKLGLSDLVAIPHADLRASSCITLDAMCKYAKHCDDGRQEKAPLLVTGTGASGTLATLAKLENLGFKLGGELDGRDGTVAWNSRCAGSRQAEGLLLDQSARLTSFLSKKFHLVFHLVRHPLKTIASYQFFTLNMAIDLNIKVWTFIETFTPEVNFREEDGSWKHPVERIMLHWLSWNHMIEDVADYRFQVENPQAAKVICEKVHGTLSETQLGIPLVRSLAQSKCDEDANRKTVSQTFHKHSAGGKIFKYSWEDLKAVNPLLAREVWEMAERYGYKRDPPPTAHTKKPRKRLLHPETLLCPGQVTSNNVSPHAFGHWPEHAFDGKPSTFYAGGYGATEGDFLLLHLNSRTKAPITEVRVTTGGVEKRSRSGAKGGQLIKGCVFVATIALQDSNNCRDFKKVTCGFQNGIAIATLASPQRIDCVKVAVTQDQHEELRISEIALTPQSQGEKIC